MMGLEYGELLQDTEQRPFFKYVLGVLISG